MSKMFKISEDMIVGKAYEAIKEVVMTEQERCNKDGYNFVSLSFESERAIAKIVNDCEDLLALFREIAEPADPQR